MHSIIVIKVADRFPVKIDVHHPSIFNYDYAVELVEKMVNSDCNNQFVRNDNFWTCEADNTQIAIISIA